MTILSSLLLTIHPLELIVELLLTKVTYSSALKKEKLCYFKSHPCIYKVYYSSIFFPILIMEMFKCHANELYVHSLSVYNRFYPYKTHCGKYSLRLYTPNRFSLQVQ